MKLLTITLAVILLSMANFSNAQSINPKTAILKWNATGFNDVLSNVSVEQTCYFKVNTTTEIEWVQNESTKFTFDVSSVDGEWNDVQSNGQLVYHFSYKGGVGTITIKRDSSLTLLFQLTGLASGDISNQYSLSGFEPE